MLYNYRNSNNENKGIKMQYNIYQHTIALIIAERKCDDISKEA